MCGPIVCVVHSCCLQRYKKESIRLLLSLHVDQLTRVRCDFDATYATADSSNQHIILTCKHHPHIILTQPAHHHYISITSHHPHPHVWASLSHHPHSTSTSSSHQHRITSSSCMSIILTQPAHHPHIILTLFSCVRIILAPSPLNIHSSL